jgi:hypothetical protein
MTFYDLQDIPQLQVNTFGFKVAVACMTELKIERKSFKRLEIPGMIVRVRWFPRSHDYPILGASHDPHCRPEAVVVNVSH